MKVKANRMVWVLHRVFTLLILSAVFGASMPAAAQNYPSRVIRIVTMAAGGGNDFAVRYVAPLLSENLKQPVIVDNRGGSAAMAAIAVQQSAPDGYTLLAYNNALWTLPMLQKVDYRVEDFTPAALAMTAPLILVVHPSVPAQNVSQLVALAKKRPGALNYASGDTGGSGHLAAELFKFMAGVDLVQVSYRGTGAALVSIISGETQVMFPNSGPVSGHIKAGKLRALAVTSPRPSALTPGLPTVAQTVPGYEALSIYGLFAPVKTPPALVQRINEEYVRVLNRPDVKEHYFKAGVEVVGGSAEQMGATMNAEVARLTKVIKATAIRAE
ncbi:MAG: tripartite tricarboxylate transporter substrate binding protein [Burkholderiales bacterium]|nr:tripartite tricarboxylate transporter substrate binding protein [Burkholderiales bacterium]